MSAYDSIDPVHVCTQFIYLLKYVVWYAIVSCHFHSMPEFKLLLCMPAIAYGIATHFCVMSS